jgi:hypothetical protein
MDASGSIPLPPIPLKKTGESIIGAALLAAARIGQRHAKPRLKSLMSRDQSPFFVTLATDTFARFVNRLGATPCARAKHGNSY